MFTLKFETDNAAFEDENAPHEISHILGVVRGKIEAGKSV